MPKIDPKRLQKKQQRTQEALADPDVPPKTKLTYRRALDALDDLLGLAKDRPADAASDR